MYVNYVPFALRLRLKHYGSDLMSTHGRNDVAVSDVTDGTSADTTERLMTVSELAGQLRYSPGWVRARVRSGEIPYCPKTRVSAWNSRGSDGIHECMPHRSRIPGQTAARLRSCWGEPSSVVPHRSGRLDQPQSAERDRIPPRGGPGPQGANGQEAPVQ